LWCLAELGLTEGKDFERIDAGLHFGINRTPEFLKMNPNGLVPTLEVGDLILWESNTILRYLAKEHDKKKRFPTDIRAQYSSEKWLDWQLGTLWPTLRIQLFGVLDQVLSEQSYCSGNQFHIGDIALALCVSRWILLNKTFPEETGPRAELKNIDAWLKHLEQETCFNDIAEKELNIVK
jgi:glutathione S-transferase